MKVHVKGVHQAQEVLGYSSKSYLAPDEGGLLKKDVWVVKPVIIIKDRESGKILAVDLDDVVREG